MEDWDAELERPGRPAKPIRPAGVVAAVVMLALVVVGVGLALRQSRPQSPFAAPAATGTVAPDRLGAGPGPDTERDAALRRAADMLLGGGDLYAGDPDALHLSPGQTVTLRNKNTEVQVTPGAITTGTCDAGPVLTVTVSVQFTRGSADLPAGNFTLLGRDGSTTRSTEACSTGFTEVAERRTIAFAATDPGRLAYGPDPEHPIALWQLA